MAVYADLAQWTRRPEALARTSLPRTVLLGDPAAFTVAAVHNPHMADAEGHPQRINSAAARAEWLALAAAYRALGLAVEVLPADPSLPDLCFTANPSLALPLPQGWEIWLAHMTHASRRPEADLHAEWYATRGLTLRRMPDSVARFEGGGDGIPHPGRFLLHAGVGPRSALAAWEFLAAAHPDLDVLLYSLEDPRFYHLDTALAALDERHCLYVPEAFDARGRELLAAAFAIPIPIALEEALNFAGNAHCPDGRHVLLPKGNPLIEHALARHDFIPIPLDTREFQKSGGSVYCLKQAFGLA